MANRRRNRRFPHGNGSTMEWLIVWLAALAVSHLLTPLAGGVGRRLQAVSHPDRFRRLHAAPTPQSGGLAVCVGLVLALGASVLLGMSPEGWALRGAIAVSAIGFCLVGLYDDIIMLRARQKLALQVLALLPVLAAGLWVERVSILGCEFFLGKWGLAWTALWMLLGVNAMNLIDGMDGLAGTVGSVVALGTAAVALVQGHVEAAVAAVALAGALGGFLIHNLPPAKIYLGDCGSTLVGFALACLTVEAASGGTRCMPLIVPSLLFFVPLLDTGLAILRRVLLGRGIMTGDREHMHHRLLDRGLSTARALLVLGSFTLLTVAAALGGQILGQGLMAALVVVGATVGLAFSGWIAHEELRLVARSVGAVLARLGILPLPALEDSERPATAGGMAWRLRLHRPGGDPSRSVVAEPSSAVEKAA